MESLLKKVVNIIYFHFRRLKIMIVCNNFSNLTGKMQFKCRVRTQIYTSNKRKQELHYTTQINSFKNLSYNDLWNWHSCRSIGFCGRNGKECCGDGYFMVLSSVDPEISEISIRFLFQQLSKPSIRIRFPDPKNHNPQHWLKMVKLMWLFNYMVKR